MGLSKKNNLETLRLDKSRNMETHYFLIKGRISLKAFFLRLIMVGFVLGGSYYAMCYYQDWLYNDWLYENPNDPDAEQYYKIIYWSTVIFAIFMSFFLLIQMVKRVHDVNKSGWWLLVPFYNIVLLFTPGDKTNNDYGVCPTEDKSAYFNKHEENN